MSDLGMAPASVDGSPIVGDVGGPTFEQLAALVPDPGDAPAPTTTTPPVAPMQHKEGETAEAAPAEAAPEAPAVPPPAAPDDEAKRALEASEAAARRAREGSRRYREILEAQQRQQAEVQRAAAEAAELRRRVEEAAKLEAELKADPYAALKKRGMTERELAERALQEGTPEKELRDLLARQEQILAQERAAREALEQRLEAERQAVARSQAEQAFYKVADNDAKFPRLSELGPQAQLAVARAALQQIASNGYETANLSDEQVAQACEQFLAPKKPRAAAPAKPPAPAAAAPAKAASTTLTNSVATTRATAPRPFDELSDEEQLAAIAANLPDP